jgi:anti-sigma factor RsiW
MTPDYDLPCIEFVELVTAYLENALPLPERVRFEAHRLLCRACATYLEQVRQTVCWLRRTAAPAITPATRQALLRQFRSWRRDAG